MTDVKSNTHFLRAGTKKEQFQGKGRKKLSLWFSVELVRSYVVYCILEQKEIVFFEGLPRRKFECLSQFKKTGHFQRDPK